MTIAEKRHSVIKSSDLDADVREAFHEFAKNPKDWQNWWVETNSLIRWIQDIDDAIEEGHYEEQVGPEILKTINKLKELVCKLPYEWICLTHA